MIKQFFFLFYFSVVTTRKDQKYWQFGTGCFYPQNVMIFLNSASSMYTHWQQGKPEYTECSLNIVFSLNFCDFSELCQFCCSAGVLRAWCVYTHWHRGTTEKGNSSEYFKIYEKKPQYLVNTLYLNIFEINTIINEHPLDYRL